MLHPIPLFCVSYVLGGALLDFADKPAGHAACWWDRPNAMVLGAGATAFVAYVIVITEVLRDVRYKDQWQAESEPQVHEPL
jgi:hypothetical protein